MKSSPHPAQAADRLARLDRDHVWHPFTPMRQWCAPGNDPVIIERGEGFELIDTVGNRYIDGVSSLWCNVHGHRVPGIDRAIRDQLDKIAHTTLLGLASPPSIELAARLVELVNRNPNPETRYPKLTKVFYSDAGATAVEAAMKMAVGYWHHTGKPRKRKFVALDAAYHGDTTGSMSAGYSDLFHRPFASMVFEVLKFAIPQARPCESASLAGIDELLARHADEVAAVILEPVMQGAAGMIAQPPGFVRRVRELCTEHGVLLIADEVATGFGRTGTMFACEQEGVTPDLMCLAKGLTGGYLPLAATLATDEIFRGFCGELDEGKTFFHGHTYTGNALACAAALASLDLFEKNDVLANVRRNAETMRGEAAALHTHALVKEVRQRGIMMGIELNAPPAPGSAVTARDLCHAMRAKGLIIRPLGNVLVLMPAPAMPPEVLRRMMGIVVETITATSPANDFQ